MNNKLSVKELNLLFLVLGLLFIKFAIVPVIDWQDSKLVEIQMKQKQVDKANNLIASKDDIITLSERVKTQLIAVEEKVPAIDVDKFKISTQKNLTALLAKHDLKVERAAWIIQPDPQDVFEVTIQLTIAGRMSDFLNSHLAIEEAFPGAKISKLRLNITRHLEKSMGTLKGRISLSFLVRELEDKANDKT